MNIYRVGNFDWHDKESARQHLAQIRMAGYIFKGMWIFISITTIIMFIKVLS